ncbi:Glycogenin-1 [Seminavis robusta]|uniref:Glycogenin-1 n=1 Tax=Seminavis robusta TaxID=568900 RepID=A0A9N8DY12_9STRA|nr:Glycogenin-1 [Seminavis robusta]|eukprot:Sro463_g148200.1 Glycogenin-1 (235) ;mRNA; f:26643-27347
MLNDNNLYVKGAVKLGRALQRQTHTPHDRVVMELQHKPLHPHQWERLHRVGFIKCVVSPIHPPKKEFTRHDLREKLAVLHIWAMQVYQRVVFVDADTFPRAGIDHLFTMDLQGKPIGVTRDIRNQEWVNTFNSGVLLLNPSLQEHERLVGLLRKGIRYEYTMGDQGFLNTVYRNNWHEIGFVNNANMAVYEFQREFWDQYKMQDINIIHYTMDKPWRCSLKGVYAPICNVWINA